MKENLIYPGGITYKNCEFLKEMIITPLQRVSVLEETIKQFKFINFSFSKLKTG